MRLLLLTFTVVIGLNFLMYGLSKNLLSQVSATYDQAIHRRMYLISNAQIQRALSLFSVGLSTNQKSFVIEARKIFSETAAGLERIKAPENNVTEIINELNTIRREMEVQELSRRDLIALMDRIENVSMKMALLESARWDLQLKSSEGLLSEYESLNLLMNIIAVFITLSLAGLMFFLHRKYSLEEDISRENKIKSSLFTSLNEAIFVTDSKGNVTSCNQSCVRMTGLDSRQVVGRPLESFFGQVAFERDLGSGKTTLHDLISKGKSFSGLIMHSRHNKNERWFSINLQPVLDQKDMQFSMIFSFTDISEQIHSKKKIKEQQEQIVESSKSDLIAQMAGGIAHEINNPLTAISTNMELLEMKAKSKEMLESIVVQKSTSKVIDTINRIGKIVNGMLALSRKKELNFETIEIGKVINTAADFSRLILEKSEVELFVKEENFDSSIECYPIQISQVLINLIKNSVEAVANLEERWIEIEVLNLQNGIQINITDSGTGMSEELKERILLPFFTSKKVGEGTGLGLSISRTIIENHHGTLDVSRDSKNTQFNIYIPYRHADIKAAA